LQLVFCGSHTRTVHAGCYGLPRGLPFAPFVTHAALLRCPALHHARCSIPHHLHGSSHTGSYTFMVGIHRSVAAVTRSVLDMVPLCYAGFSTGLVVGSHHLYIFTFWFSIFWFHLHTPSFRYVARFFGSRYYVRVFTPHWFTPFGSFYTFWFVHACRTRYLVCHASRSLPVQTRSFTVYFLYFVAVVACGYTHCTLPRASPHVLVAVLAAVAVGLLRRTHARAAATRRTRGLMRLRFVYFVLDWFGSHCLALCRFAHTLPTRGYTFSRIFSFSSAFCTVRSVSTATERSSLHTCTWFSHGFSLRTTYFSAPYHIYLVGLVGLRLSHGSVHTVRSHDGYLYTHYLPVTLVPHHAFVFFVRLTHFPFLLPRARVLFSAFALTRFTFRSFVCCTIYVTFRCRCVYTHAFAFRFFRSFHHYVLLRFTLPHCAYRFASRLVLTFTRTPARTSFWVLALYTRTVTLPRAHLRYGSLLGSLVPHTRTFRLVYTYVLHVRSPHTHRCCICWFACVYAPASLYDGSTHSAHAPHCAYLVCTHYLRTTHFHTHVLRGYTSRGSHTWTQRTLCIYAHCLHLFSHAFVTLFFFGFPFSFYCTARTGLPLRFIHVRFFGVFAVCAGCRARASPSPHNVRRVVNSRCADRSVLAYARMDITRRDAGA